jgi:serine O-acetyltransferase
MKIYKEELTKLRKDWERRFRKYPEKGGRWRLKYYWSNVQYRTILYYRLWSAYRSIPILRYWLERAYRLSSIRSGLEIFVPPGGGLIVPHFGPIKLNADQIGENLYVFHNVTIGNDYVTGRPTIGNNVFISAHCVIVGKVSIGNNVVIGANSLVNSDIPSNSFAAGSPAKVIKSIDSDYIQKTLLHY